MCNNIWVKNFADLKIAIIHDQLTQYGGAERALETILDIFPQADLYTGSYKPINISQRILKHRIVSSGVPTWLSFLMPLAFEGFDLRQYDIVISEGTAWPKGVITNPQQLHVSYIYTPPRFLYRYATEGQKRDKWYFKPFLKVIDHFLLIWDFSAAQRPDYLLSISQEVAKRVKKFYGRDSHIVYPPVDVSGPLSGIHKSRQVGSLGSAKAGENKIEEYYLCISRLSAYKNIDLLIEAFKLTDLKLKIAGTGKEEDRLRRLAGQNIELLGFVTDQEKQELLANCKGFIFPTDYEDFGIVPVEALSYGKPVLCHRSGGSLEIVQESITGMFFDDLSPQKLAEKIIEFDKTIDASLYDREKTVESVKKFSADRFKQEFGDFVRQKWEEKHYAGTT